MSGENERVQILSKPKNGNGKLPPDLNPKLKSLKCANCGRFLAYYAMVEGSIVIPCRRCHHYTAVDTTYVKVTTP